MRVKLAVQAMVKFVLGAVVIAALVFLSAGTLSYMNGWLFLGILFVPMLLMELVLLIKNPELLAKRLNSKEQQSGQKSIIKLSGLMFVVGFILAGLDYRFHWFALPQQASIAAAAVFLLGYAMYAEVLRENVYLSRTVEVQENQQVIDTGLYGVVRHPMYSATILMFLAMPLVLGSLVAFGVFLLYPLLLIARLSNEEKVLEAQLDGYAAYKKKVKYRLIPLIW